MSTPPNREVAIFSAALELPASERAAYLAEACADDPALRQRLEALLRVHEEAIPFLETPPPGAHESPMEAEVPGATVRLSGSPAEKAGDRIGRYKLLQQLGEGGCGVVYMAEQEEPVRRRVALKVIKLGMDTKQVVARFEAERQALALMDHPNIAKVFDAGATDTGRPFFVMELVRGIKITDFCNENKVSTEDRLKLFIQVCQAIQHAHQKGVIHRDIKPSNVLVADHDGVPVPKIIDFGIAKATTDQRLTDKTLFTAFEQFMGTPAYMSPEQAKLSGLDIDTRSDIYSLGVLLYELLTGKTPFEAKRLLEMGLDEIRRIIREEEPVRPSTRLSTMAAADLTEVAKQRHAEPAKLSSLIRGDLDWIVMKCLEKDRQRRYETANGLAMDIQRHLNCEPVTARPPSRLYEFQKTVRRHMLGFAAAAGLITVLAVGTLVSTWQAIRIAREHRAATEKLFDSYLAQARTLRLGGREGQRFESLATLLKAAAIRPSAGVRSEAIACLALTDSRFSQARRIADPEHESWDSQLELRAHGEPDGGVRIWRTRDNKEVAVLPGTGAAVEYPFGFSPEGRYVGVKYRGGRNVVWDIKSQQPVIGEIPGARGVDFSADGQTLAASCQDGQLRRFGLHPPRPLPSLALERHFWLLRLCPQGGLFAGCEAETKKLEVRDLRDASLLRTLSHAADVTSAAWSSDGKYLAAGCEDGRVVIWDATSGEKQNEFRGHQDSVVSVGFSHSGRLLGSSSWDGEFRLWDLAAGRGLLTALGWSYQVSFSTDDRSIGYLVRGSQTGSLEVTPSSISHRLNCTKSPRRGSWSTDVSPDGRLVAAATSDGVHFWADTQTMEPFFLPAPNCYSAIFTPDGANLIVCDRRGLARWSLQRSSGTMNDELRIGPRQAIGNGLDFNYAALSADGRWIAAADFGANAVSIYELSNPSNHFDLVSQRQIQFPAFSPDGHWVAAGNWKGSGVTVWNFESRRIVSKLPAASIAWGAFSPDGRSLATCSTNCEVWETGSWKHRYSLQPNRSEPHTPALAFSPDARMLAVVLEPAVVRLVVAETGELLADLEDSISAKICYLRFSPDGTRLYALQWDQQIQVWDLRRIREELSNIGLDWNSPPFPRVAARPEPSAKPLRISIAEAASPKP